MQHIDRDWEPHGVDRAESVALPVLHDLENCRRPLPLQRLGLLVLLSGLRHMKGKAEYVLHLTGHLDQGPPGARNPHERF